MLKVRIAGLGSCLPERIVQSRELEQQWNLSEGWIARVAGVTERRYVTLETTVGMAASASRQAIAHAGLDASDIDLIIGASITPQQAVPCTAVFVQRELGLSEPSCPCFDVNATCLSFLFAFHTAAHLVSSGAYCNVLIFSSEIHSISMNPLEPASAVLFGDAAAAAVVSASEEGDPACVWDAQFETDSRAAEATQYPGCGSLHPPNDPTTTREMHLFTMDGTAIYRLAIKKLPDFVERFFVRLGWDRACVDAVVSHQASRHGLQLITERLGFCPAQVLTNLEKRGNCGAASVPLLLSEAVHSGRIQRGSRVILAGTGAGISMGMIALTF